MDKLEKYLRKIILDVIAGRIEVVSFCDTFETIFNLEIDKSSLDVEVRSAFSSLFEVVIWYSPFPDERSSIPNYVDEETVIAAARQAASDLSL